MAVKMDPLGAPELGMSRAEILEYSSSMLEASLSGTELFYTLLFAYVVAMYIAGKQLTKLQYVIANAMYLIVMSMQIFLIYHTTAVQNLWIGYAGLVTNTGNELWMISGGVNAMLVLLSLWFSNKIRHPTSEPPSALR
ncbi:MAG: hypothetical protein ABJN62_08790 [Halioglobus sp.]